MIRGFGKLFKVPIPSHHYPLTVTHFQIEELSYILNDGALQSATDCSSVQCDPVGHFVNPLIVQLTSFCKNTAVEQLMDGFSDTIYHLFFKLYIFGLYCILQITSLYQHPSIHPKQRACVG